MLRIILPLACLFWLMPTVAAGADPVELLGFTADKPLGQLGVFHYNQLCRATFGRPDARMCSALEMVETTVVPGGLTGEAWVLPYAELDDHVTVNFTQKTCVGWTQTVENGIPVEGLRVTAAGSFLLAECNTAAAVACCASTAAPGQDHEMVGHTQLAYPGDSGVLNFTAACQVDFGPAAGMCTVEYAWRTTSTPPGLVEPAWIRKTPVVVGPHFRAPGSSTYLTITDCAGWSQTVGVGAAITENGGVVHADCGVARPVACCTPVPEPSAMQGLVPGVALLCALSRAHARRIR